MLDIELKDLIEKSINGTLYDIAQVVYYLLKDDYVSARLKNKLWFKFDGNKWCQIEEGPYYELSTTIVSAYESYLKDLLCTEITLKNDKACDNLETESKSIDEQLKLVQTEITKTSSIVDKLKNVNFKESLCKECLYLFYNRDFISELDKKEHLIVFKESVYDLKEKLLRNGEKSDKASIYIDAIYDDVIVNEDVNYDEMVNNFIQFRKNLLKKRHPKNVYTLSYF
uniref:Bacteriophage/plasmid primase P4 C-terminal domain-containing protein n=1 Tax=viral metagenome TaxID=1070528 RepID=A0A6C0CTU8_9ZZZZ